jgi:hypothetical protein
MILSTKFTNIRLFLSNNKKYVNPNILDLYITNEINIQQLDKHFELIDGCCDICKLKTKCINKCIISFT